MAILLNVLYSDFGKLILAALLGGIIGVERGRSGQVAGMRTHILVALGAALATITGMYVVNRLGMDTDPLRLSAQVISGIGFLGVGTILIRDHQVTGLTTAAGLWATASVGIAVGVGYYEAALIVVAIIWIANSIIAAPKKKSEKRSADARVYAELNDVNKVNDFIDLTYGLILPGSLNIVPSRSGIGTNVGIELELRPENQEGRELVCARLLEETYVSFII